MARRRTIRGRQNWAADLGSLLGQAFAEGLAEGLQASVNQVEQMALPLAEEVLELLRGDYERVAKEVAEMTAAQAVAAAEYEATRRCGHASCERRAIARGLCRKHYARKIYQERKDREDGGKVVDIRAAKTATSAAAPAASAPLAESLDVSASSPAARVSTPRAQGGRKLEKKTVAAVAPIVRRKKTDGIDAPFEAVAAPVEAIEETAAPAASDEISAEELARKWGVRK